MAKPQDKCWVYKQSPVSVTPLYGANGKIVCVNYCIYGIEGEATCDKWQASCEARDK